MDPTRRYQHVSERRVNLTRQQLEERGKPMSETKPAKPAKPPREPREQTPEETREETPNLTRQQLEEMHYSRFREAGLGEREARERARQRAREQCE